MIEETDLPEPGATAGRDDATDAGPPPAPPGPTPGDPGPSTGPATGAKADLGKRLVAILIDGAIAFVVGLIPGIGGILGAAYMLLRDGLEFDFMSHRSVGKQVMKLHLETASGAPSDIGTSVQRNWVFAVAPLISLLIVIPIIGWILIPFVALAAIALGITELVLVLTDPEGRRLGDKMAGTRVVED